MAFVPLNYSWYFHSPHSHFQEMNKQTRRYIQNPVAPENMVFFVVACHKTLRSCARPPLFIFLTNFMVFFQSTKEWPWTLNCSITTLPQSQNCEDHAQKIKKSVKISGRESAKGIGLSTIFPYADERFIEFTFFLRNEVKLMSRVSCISLPSSCPSCG